MEPEIVKRLWDNLRGDTVVLRATVSVRTPGWLKIGTHTLHIELHRALPLIEFYGYRKKEQNELMRFIFLNCIFFYLSPEIGL